MRPRIRPAQEKQTCLLFAHAGRVDPQLKEENDFLNENADMQYVVRRLREQADSHLARGAVRRDVHARDIVSDLSPHGATREERLRDPKRRGGGGGKDDGVDHRDGGGGGAPGSHKRQALYLLRHVRVREFKRRLLDILNYFASIRRRICFDSHGYALPCDLENGGSHRSAMHREALSLSSEEEDPSSTVGDSFTSRIARYSATPADFQAFEGNEPAPPIQTLPTPIPQGGMGSEAILKASGIENRDDVYMVKGRNLVVMDRFEQQIMYDVALRDMEDLELRLLQAGSLYMQQHIASTPPTQQDVDRIAVLEDLFEAEAWFQDAKRKVVDSHMEAYEHVQSLDAQRKVAQTVLDIIALRPSLDLSEPYFTQSYTAETINLELEHSLLREIINAQITDEKRALQSIHRHGLPPEWHGYAGIPPAPVPDTRLFHPLFPGSSVVNVLDFYGSLDVLAEIPDLVSAEVSAVEHRFDVTSASALSGVRREVLQQMLVEWKVLAEEERVQRQLQGALLNEDGDTAALVEEAEKVQRVITDLVAEGQSLLSRKTGAAAAAQTQEAKKQDVVWPQSVQLWCQLMESVLCRIDLMRALYETEVLYNIHRKQGAVMGVSVRKFQFEPMDFEARKTYPEVDELDNDDVDMAEIVSLRVEYLSHLAIAEFEQGMAAFDFHSAEGLKKILSYGVPDVRRALSVQVVQKNLLTAVVLHNQIPIDHYHESCSLDKAKEMLERSTFVTQQDGADTSNAASSPSPAPPARPPPVTTRFGQHAVSSLGRAAPQETQQTARIRPKQGLAAFPKWVNETYIQRDQLQKLFVSVNHVKSVHRRCILEELNKRTAEILQSKRPELLRKRMKELKHTLIHEYCLGIMKAVYPYALRWQIAQVSHAIRRKAARNPSLEKQTFCFGGAGDLLRHVATSGQARPKHVHSGISGSAGQGQSTETQACMLAGDGRIENLWYVPHFMQVYTQCNWDHHETLRDDVKLGAGGPGQHAKSGSRMHEHWHTSDATHLPTTFCLLSMFTVLHHLHSVVVTHEAFQGLAEPASVFAERGVPERLQSELSKLQQELDGLSDASDTTAALQFLEAYRRTLFLRVLVALGRIKKRLVAPGISGAPPPAAVVESSGSGLPGIRGVRAAAAAGVSTSAHPGHPPMRHSLALIEAGTDQLVAASGAGGEFMWFYDHSPMVRIVSAAAPMRKSEEQPRGDYREALRRVAEYQLDMLTQGDADPSTAAAVTPLQLVDQRFYEALCHPSLGPWLGCEGHIPGTELESFLLGLSDEDRKAIITEDERKTEPFLQQEVVQDKAFVDEVATLSFFTGQAPSQSSALGRDRVPEQSTAIVRGCAAALEITERCERLVLFLCTQLAQMLGSGPPQSDTVEEQFTLLKVVQKRARDKYLEELQEANEEESGAGGLGQKRHRRRKQSEVGLRRTMVLVLSQEINRRLLEHFILVMHNVTEKLTTATAVALGGEQGESLGGRGVTAEKLHMFGEFHSSIMSRAVSTRQEGSERDVIFKIPEEAIASAMDVLAKRVRDWQTAHIKNVADVAEAVVQNHRMRLFNTEQKVEHLTRLRELDRKALNRRVQSKVTDENYDLRHCYQTVVKMNSELKGHIARIQEVARKEVKDEYEEKISNLQNENRLMDGKFKDYKKSLYREMQVNLEEIKRQAMMSIGKSEIAPLHMKRQALKIAISDEEMNVLKDQNNELQMTITKLKLWHDMKLMNLVGRFEKKIEQLEQEKEEASKRHWGDKAIEKEREDDMRAQLSDLQQKLSSAEMEVEQLLRDLDLQERKKKHLVQWKVAHQKEIDELRRKAKRYEKYEKHDIDKLLNDLEREKERARLQTTDASARKKEREDPAIASKDREIARLREDLRREKRLKSKAFAKLDQMREDQEAVTDEMVWQRKYFECASELQRTLRDLTSCKDQLQRHGVQVPNFPSRPNSAATSHRRPYSTNEPAPAAAEADEAGPVTIGHTPSR